MPRKYEGPRLYLRRRKGRPDRWVIRDGYTEIATSAADVETAKAIFSNYCSERNIPDVVAPIMSGVRPVAGFVYFISTNEVPDYPVKIGITFGESIAQRLAGLQTACPYQLEVLASYPASPDAERMLHIQLHAHRLKGEWFARSRDLDEIMSKYAHTPTMKYYEKKQANRINHDQRTERA